MLEFTPDKFLIPAEVDINRVKRLNNKPILDGDIVYLSSRELRLEDNWAVQYGLELARKYNKKFKIIVILSRIVFSERQELIFKEGLNFFNKNSALNNIDFEIVEELPSQIGALIVDFSPLTMNFKNDDNLNCAVFEVDSHNIIPARYVSDKQEFSAATLRRKIYGNIGCFLTDFPEKFNVRDNKASIILNDFIQNKLDLYAEFKSLPNKDVTSGLSPYLHFGFISSQRIAIEVINSMASRENKEAYLEELIVRKELSDNYCLYNKNYTNLNGVLDWAKLTLDAHKQDIRAYLYTYSEFKNAKTHDEIWNYIQRGLIDTGRIHGYLRMYWAKKILEWSKSPEDAVKIAIDLNDKYALDGNDPNGYVGILWSIGGLHDRAFTNRFVTGKIRYMGLEKVKKTLEYKWKENII